MPSNPVVVLTREHQDNLDLLQRIDSKDIQVLSYPCISTLYVPESAWEIGPKQQLCDFRVIVFTSKRGVLSFRSQRNILSDLTRLIGVVGKSTGEIVEECFGRKPDVVAARPTGEELAGSLIKRLEPGEAVLHVCGDKTTGNFRQAMEEFGFEVTELVVYKNRAPELDPLDIEGPVIVFFASPSAARRYFEVNGFSSNTVSYVTIGPTTEAYLNDLNLEHVSRVEEPTNECLFEKIYELVKAG